MKLWQVMDASIHAGVSSSSSFFSSFPPSRYSASPNPTSLRSRGDASGTLASAEAGAGDVPSLVQGSVFFPSLLPLGLSVAGVVIRSRICLITAPVSLPSCRLLSLPLDLSFITSLLALLRCFSPPSRACFNSRCFRPYPSQYSLCPAHHRLLQPPPRAVPSGQGDVPWDRFSESVCDCGQRDER